MTEDRDPFSALLEECRSFHRRGQHVRALDCYRKCIGVVAAAHDPLILAALLSEAGGEHRDCDNYDHAIELLVTAYALIPSDTPADDPETAAVRAQTKRLLAITFRDKYGPRKPDVLKLLDEARLDCIASGNLSGEANVLQHIGGCYLELGLLAEADKFLSEALEKAKKSNAQQLVGWIFDNLAEVEIERNEWGQALELARRSRAIAETTGDREAEAATLMTEARIQSRLGHWAESVKIATDALELFVQNNNLRQTISARRHLAKLLYERQRLDEAFAINEQALRTASRLHLERYQALIHLDLAKLEIDRHDYPSAHRHAINARFLAEEEGMIDILDKADALLRRHELT